jgi:hypothetical protein
MSLGIVHLARDVPVVVEVAQHDFAIKSLLLRHADDTASNDGVDGANAIDVRIEPPVGDLVGGEGGREGDGRGIDLCCGLLVFGSGLSGVEGRGETYHFLGDIDGFGEDGTEADAGEDVHVVS